MFDLKFYNLIKKVAYFRNKHSNYKEHRTMEDIMEIHHDFLNECNIDWEILNIHIAYLYHSYLYFKDDDTKFDRVKSRLLKCSINNGSLRRNDVKDIV